MVVETEQGVEVKLLDIDRDLLMIPNVAIHMNRKVNDGYAYNPATDTIPLLGDRDVKVILKKYSPIGEMSSFAKDYTESIFRAMGHIASQTTPSAAPGSEE